MPNVNLISARRAERVRMTQVAKSLFVGTLVAAGLGVGLIAFMGGRQLYTSGMINEQEKALQELRPVVLEIEAAEAERNALAPKLETLTQAQGRSKRWFDVLEGLKRAVPEETWLTAFATEAAGDAPALKMNGITSTQARVGETMMRLSAQAEQYEKVDLRYTTTADRDGVKNVEFELAAQLKPLTAPVEEGKDAAKTN